MQKKCKYFVFLISFLFLTACAGKSGNSRGANGDSEISAPTFESETIETEPIKEGEVYGPEIPVHGVDHSMEPAENTQPINIHKEPKLCVALGPGMAKGIALAAALEVLVKNDIPIQCIVGTEMGALVGALFASSNGSINNLQWQLFKINNENYFSFPLLTLKSPISSLANIHDFLQTAFKSKKIESFPIRFATVLADEEGGVRRIIEGNSDQILSASLSLPGIFDSVKILEKKYASGAIVNPLPIELAKDLGATFVVAIDVLSLNKDQDAGRKIERRVNALFSSIDRIENIQSRAADVFIKVDTSKLLFTDFEKQGELLSSGRRAAQEKVEEIKYLWNAHIGSH